MSAIRLLWVALASCALCGLGAQTARADEAAEIYDPARMYVVDLHLPQSSRNALAGSPNEYQPGTFSIAETDGTPSGIGSFSAPVDVGIRLKGSYSFRPLSGKSAFKIKFPKDALFHGIRVLTLNNMVEDPSMIHETLAYTAFRGAGVPGSRTGYAYVYVDGEDYGIHLNVETMDAIALAHRFGSFNESVQHLYEGENAADANPGQAGDFEVDEGDEGDLGDLEALISAVHSSGPGSWAQRVAHVIDLEEMTRMWAAEKYAGAWDGYAGTETPWTPNNYYLYSDPTGRFQMLPWGTDETWQLAYRLPFDGPAGEMFDRCITDAECNAIYRESLAAVRDAIGAMDLDALAAETAAMLAPWQEMEDEESTREERAPDEIEAAVADTRAFLAGRSAEVDDWLGVPPARPAQVAPPTPSGAEDSHVVRWLFYPRAPRLRVGRPRLANGVLRTRVRLRGRGRVVLRGIASSHGHRRDVCSDRVRVRHSGSLALSCPLPAWARRSLRRRPLRIVLVTRFFPAGDGAEQVVRRVTLPRR